MTLWLHPRIVLNTRVWITSQSVRTYYWTELQTFRSLRRGFTYYSPHEPTVNGLYTWNSNVALNISVGLLAYKRLWLRKKIDTGVHHGWSLDMAGI